MIDLKKKYRTRDGREVKLYAIDPDACPPICGSVKGGGNSFFMSTWYLNGSCFEGEACDLIEVIEPIECEINISENSAFFYGGPKSSRDFHEATVKFYFDSIRNKMPSGRFKATLTEIKE